jgi:hypothetical protein
MDGRGSMSKPVLTMLGQDVTRYLTNGLPVVEEQKEFDFAKLINNVFTFEMDNIDSAFSLNNSKSLFHQINWMNQPVTLDGWDGTRLMSGIITDIAPNYSGGTPKTTIMVKSSLFNYKDINIEYESSDWETPADTFKNICDLIDFTNYNTTAITRSKTIFEENSCYWKVEVKKDDGQKFQSLVEKIAEYSNSRLYSYQDYLYFEHWQPYTGGASLFIEEKDIISKPDIKSNRKILYNQYNIGYIGGVATDSTLGAASRAKYGTLEYPEMSTGDDEEMIYFKDSTSADYIGQSIIRRGHRDLAANPNVLVTSTQTIDYKFKDLMALNVYYKIDFYEESWDGKLFEVIRYAINDNTREISLTGLEVA